MKSETIEWEKFWISGFPGGPDGEESTCNAGDPGYRYYMKKLRFIPTTKGGYDNYYGSAEY